MLRFNSCPTRAMTIVRAFPERIKILSNPQLYDAYEEGRTEC